jgi:hypothetical protein
MMDWLTIAVAFMHWLNIRFISMCVRFRTDPAERSAIRSRSHWLIGWGRQT